MNDTKLKKTENPTELELNESATTLIIIMSNMS